MVDHCFWQLKCGQFWSAILSNSKILYSMLRISISLNCRMTRRRMLKVQERLKACVQLILIDVCSQTQFSETNWRQLLRWIYFYWNSGLINLLILDAYLTANVNRKSRYDLEVSFLAQGQSACIDQICSISQLGRKARSQTGNSHYEVSFFHPNIYFLYGKQTIVENGNTSTLVMLWNYWDRISRIHLFDVMQFGVCKLLHSRIFSFTCLNWFSHCVTKLKFL